MFTTSGRRNHGDRSSKARPLAMWLVVLVCFGNGATAETNTNPQTMTRDGSANAVMGWPGLVYQAVQFEPLCGNLGDDTRYQDVIDISGRCTAAMNAFGNDTEDTLAIYDSTGVRLKNVRVGNGVETCLCFAMSQAGGFKGAMCWWMDGSGRGDGWWQLSYDRILAGDYRPNVAKALPQCRNVDVDSLKASWSATAVQATATAGTETVAPASSGAIATSTSGASNSSQPTSTVGKGGGLSQSDKIALGVGLGIGIPTVLIALATLCITCRKPRIA